MPQTASVSVTWVMKDTCAMTRWPLPASGRGRAGWCPGTFHAFVLPMAGCLILLVTGRVFAAEPGPVPPAERAAPGRAAGDSGDSQNRERDEVPVGRKTGRQPRTDESDQQTRISQLVEALGAPALVQRRRAEAALLELGPRILPLLPAPVLVEDPSARETLRRVQLRLERRQARESVRGSVVQLDGRFTLEQIAAALRHQTGNHVVTDSPGGELLTLSGPDLPFWPLLTQLQEKGIRLQADSGSGRTIRLVPPLMVGSSGTAGRAGGSESIAPVTAACLLRNDRTDASEENGSRTARSSAMRLVVNDVRLRPIFGSNTRQLLNVSLEAQVEPRLRPLFLRYGGRGFVARSENGLLPAFSPHSVYELPFGSQSWSTGLRAQFVVPVSGAPASLQLSGQMSVYLAAGEAEFRFARLTDARRVSRRKGGVTVTLEQVRFTAAAKEDVADARRNPSDDGTPDATPPDDKQPGNAAPAASAVQVDLAVAWDTGGPAFESHRTWMYQNAAWLENSLGQRVPHHADLQFRQQANGGIAVTFQFPVVPGAQEGWQLVYRVPTLLIDVPVDFTFPEIPVPPVTATVKPQPGSR